MLCHVWSCIETVIDFLTTFHLNLLVLICVERLFNGEAWVLCNKIPVFKEISLVLARFTAPTWCSTLINSPTKLFSRWCQCIPWCSHVRDMTGPMLHSYFIGKYNASFVRGRCVAETSIITPTAIGSRRLAIRPTFALNRDVTWHIRVLDGSAAFGVANMETAKQSGGGFNWTSQANTSIYTYGMKCRLV